MNHPHPPAASAKRGFDNQRKTNFRRNLHRFRPVRDRILRSGEGGNIQLFRQGARGHFIPHQFQELRARADECDPGILAGLGEVRVFRKKSVTGVDHVRPLFLGESDNGVDIQVSRHRPFAFSNQVGFIGLETMHRKPVFLGVNGHRAKPDFRRGPKYANGDLTAIGDEQLFKCPRRLGRARLGPVVTSQCSHVGRVYSGRRAQGKDSSGRIIWIADITSAECEF